MSSPLRRQWTDEELAELEQEDTWDEEGGWIQPPIESPHIQVRVRFGPDDFAQIDEAARARGMTLTEYVRAATVEQVARDRSGAATR